MRSTIAVLIIIERTYSFNTNSHISSITFHFCFKPIYMVILMCYLCLFMYMLPWQPSLNPNLFKY